MTSIYHVITTFIGEGFECTDCVIIQVVFPPALHLLLNWAFLLGGTLNGTQYHVLPCTGEPFTEWRVCLVHLQVLGCWRCLGPLHKSAGGALPCWLAASWPHSMQVCVIEKQIRLIPCDSGHQCTHTHTDQYSTVAACVTLWQCGTLRVHTVPHY